MGVWHRSFGLALLCSLACKSGAGGEQAALRTGVNAASVERLHADISRLATFGTRHTFSDTESDTRGIGAARRWLAAELERISASYHGGRLSVELVEHHVPAGRRVPRAVEVVNVVATLPGQEPGRLVVVSGHYDSRSSDGDDGVGDAPGANDDASGTGTAGNVVARAWEGASDS
jgi:acetylornithine deacetylase/succinyl-diaminopimelate desuccinylase-like protein